MRRVVLISTVLALVIGVLYAPPVFAAYIDPNTGGMLFQILTVMLAFLSGILLFFSARIRMAFAKIKRRLRDHFKQQSLSKEKAVPSSEVRE